MIAMSDARTADQYARERNGAFDWNVHEAGSSLGTKNDARRPMVAQYASRSGIHSTAVRGRISPERSLALLDRPATTIARPTAVFMAIGACCGRRSEEHTSELQSPCNLVCRLLLEKKKKGLHLLVR